MEGVESLQSARVDRASSLSVRGRKLKASGQAWPERRLSP